MATALLTKKKLLNSQAAKVIAAQIFSLDRPS